MCGIFGICYGPGGPEAEDWTPSEMAELMFPAIVHRGPHAWGYMYHDRSADEVAWVKQPGKCTNKKALSSIDIPNDVSWVVGHVRYATTGKPELNQNNHPIPHGNIIGVHNGVLRGDWRDVLKETGREDKTSEVDSEAIFAAVNKWGMTKGMRRIHGDVVSVWTDVREPELLRIARTHGRPLVYTTTKAGSLVFASEECVIDELRIDHGPYGDMSTVRNKIFTVRAGKITHRSDQFRAVKDDFVSSEITGPRAAWNPAAFQPRTDVRGITDRMTPSRPRVEIGSHLSDDRGGDWPTMDKGKVDKWGGTYLGTNLWRTSDNRVMNAEEYVQHAVDQEIRRMARNSQAARNRKNPSNTQPAKGGK